MRCSVWRWVCWATPLTKGRRDYTSSSQVVAQRYDLLCNPPTAEQARTLLAKMELGQRG